MIAELREGPERVADMQVGVDEQAMQVVGQVSSGRQAEGRHAQMFDALAVLAAEVDVASRLDIERDELERRQKSFGQSGLSWSVGTSS